LHLFTIAAVGAGGRSASLTATALHKRLALIGACCAGMLGAAPASLGAQEVPLVARSPSADSARSAAACLGKTVTAIDVRPQDPYYIGLTGQFRRIARGLQALHATTKERVVRTFLQLHVGEKCTEIRRTETERVLRAQPFIADARVVAYDDGAGGVHIDVYTTDEVSLIGQINVRDRNPLIYAIKLGEGNLGGLGMLLVGEWDSNLFYRDRWAVNYTNYNFLGLPYRLSGDAVRDVLGGRWDAQLSDPFLTDLQRYGWVVGGGSQRQFFTFLTPAAPDNKTLPAVDFTRTYADLAWVTRVGHVGSLGVFGASFTRLKEAVSGTPIIVGDFGLQPDTAPATLLPLAGKFGQHQETRLNALVGYRSIRFQRVIGFDALNGPQDIPVGFQVGGLFGKSFSQLSSKDNDIFVSSSFYSAYARRNWLLGIQAEGEGRDDRVTSLWDGVLASGRAAWYWKPTASQTVIIDEEYSLGTRMRIPFQLTFADFRGGLRGYANSLLAGGERAVTRAEVRFALPPIGQLLQLGVAPFGDMGKLWALDTPFGVTTNPTYSTGIGLLAAFPANSRRTYRLDLAFPLDPDRNTGRWELRFSISTATSTFWNEPFDLSRGREPGVPAQVFNYP
jgi:hypothetical protein